MQRYIVLIFGGGIVIGISFHIIVLATHSLNRFHQSMKLVDNHNQYANVVSSSSLEELLNNSSLTTTITNQQHSLHTKVINNVTITIREQQQEWKFDNIVDEEARIEQQQRIKVPFPIFIASLPKSGTTSISNYFACGKIWNAHTFCNTNKPPPFRQMRIGQCYYSNIVQGQKPFHQCGPYNVWSDMGYPKGIPCFYPSVHGLNEFYGAYPNSTILLITRNATSWANSFYRWQNGRLLEKWKKCDKFPNKGIKGTSIEDLVQFYNWHIDQIRQFVRKHPSITYFEYQLEDDMIGTHLQQSIGINATCMRHYNNHDKRIAYQQQLEEKKKRINNHYKP